MIVFCGLFNLLISVVIISSQNECFQINSGGYERFCCDNYVRKNGECTECKSGTKSKNEEPCTPCNIGTFGRKCSFTCNCSIRQRCDRVVGCVDIKLLSTERENASSDAYAVTNENYIQTDVNQNTFETKEGLTEREIYVYSAGFGGLFILIISGLSIFIYFNRHRSKQLQINQILEHNDNPANDETLHESLYESIDENAMCDDNIPKSYPHVSLEEDIILQSGSEVSSKSSGYLHPYTTFTENNTTHLYCTQIKSDSSSTSSSSANFKRDSEYTNPYQQLQHEHKELRTTPTSDYTELSVVHYLELVDVSIKTESVSRNALLGCTETKQHNFENESHKYSDCSSSFLYLMRNSPLAKFYSVPHLQSSSKINCQDFYSNNNMNQAVKHNSI